MSTLGKVLRRKGAEPSIAVDQRVRDGAQIDVLQLAACRHAARQARDREPARLERRVHGVAVMGAVLGNRIERRSVRQ